MSRHQAPSGGPKLPKALADQVGAGKSGRTSRAPTRKDLRKQDRQAKKKQNKQHQKQPSIRAKTARSGATPRISQIQKQTPRLTTSDDDLVDGSDSEVFGNDDSDDAEEVVLPAPTPQKMSKTSRAGLEKEDAEIAALERKLGIKKKGAKAALEDGLDDLLGEIDDAVTGEGAGGKRKLQADEDWLKQKRRKLEIPAEVEDDDFEAFSDEASDGSSDIDESGEQSGSLDHDVESEADDEHLDETLPSQASIPCPTKTRENPYGAPITTTAEPSIAKYVPPSLRGTGSGSNQDESVVRLHRKIQGLVNRLSESNMLSILSSVDALYQDNARGHVTEGLINTLLALIADSASLKDTFITLHGGFIAGLYRIVGVDFGAQLLERIVQDLSISTGSSKVDTVDKKQVNLVSLLATLYTFSVISSTIIYDLLRHYISDLSETSTELLLRIVRTCGPQLRSDDPSALKDVVALISSKVSTMDKSQISVRQSFMVETITDLKNNKLKSGLGASTTRAETITRMKKLLGTLKARNTNRTSEPLRITLSDLQNADKKGKWWLVGASWHDPAKMSDPASLPSQSALPPSHLPTDPPTIPPNDPSSPSSPSSPSLPHLARSLGMNTSIRLSLFTTIMSSVDYRDAAQRITKLRLKNRQLAEIPRVIVRCVTAEEEYNPYYAYVARELCAAGKREVRMGFQFALWDVFKRTGEAVGEDDDDDDDDEGGRGEGDEGDDAAISTTEVVSLAKFYASLMKSGAVPVAVLKKLDWAYLKPKTGLLLEVMISQLILDKGKGEDVVGLLARAAEVEGLRVGLGVWLKEVMMVSEVVEKRRHKEKVQRLCEEVVERLRHGAEGVPEEIDE
ncbi:hypothetical protein KVT40_009048 [Elsinoe batatas]|uniref:MI domain-containing protein n=1 Tax=Elsinoe batatas TaxID=2601811 RepID=A0A8K0KV36_9PEZI|nr:hypothetical protein KVT40_009048 [Elsinoe batatas]